METYPQWLRLHPVAIDETLATAVQARLHDPLWLLGRQWQFGELRHDAGATPVDVRIEGSTAPITRLRGRASPGTDDAVTVSTTGAPLEALVEREAVPERGLDNLRLRTEAGQHLLRLLGTAGLGARAPFWVGTCPFPTPADSPADADAPTREWLALVQGRVPDGAALPAAIRQHLAPDAPAPPIAEDEAAVLRAWLAWAEARFDAPAPGPSTWDPRHLEYAFAVAGPGLGGEAVLAAPEYTEGRLDWFAFEQEAGSTLGAAGATTPRRAHRIPAPLDFAGMPNPRFWTFENPGMRFEALELLSDPRTPPSPPTLLVLDFALGYSDDWFLVPLVLDAWSMFEAAAVAVTDVFGDTHLAQPPDGRWAMFRLDTSGQAPGLSRLFVAADPIEAGEGPPVEELHLLRDEVANVAWAVERLVPHPLGHGAAIAAPATETTSGPVPPAGLNWSLAPPAPPGCWLPLLPVAPGQLTLGVLWNARSAQPLGVVLDGLRGGNQLHQEEVPPSGVQVLRRWQSARALDGSLHWWVGRSKTPRQVDIAPALRFDLVAWR